MREEKNEEKKSPEPVFVPADDCELWIFSVVMIIALWGWLVSWSNLLGPSYLRMMLFEDGWEREKREKKKFVVKMYREKKIKEEEG